jgi:hypothetical protein
MEVRVNGSFSRYKCCDLQRLISAEVLEYDLKLNAFHMMNASGHGSFAIVAVSDH